VTAGWRPVVASALAGLAAGLALRSLIAAGSTSTSLGAGTTSPVPAWRSTSNGDGGYTSLWGGPSAALDAARSTLAGLESTCAEISATRPRQGSRLAAAALLTGVGVTIGREAEEAIRRGEDEDVATSLVFLLSSVLDTIDTLRGIEAV